MQTPGQSGDPLLTVTRYQYDGFGRLEQVSSPEVVTGGGVKTTVRYRPRSDRVAGITTGASGEQEGEQRYHEER